MDARLLQLCDAAAALILTGWNASATPATGDDAVQRVWSPTISFTPDSPEPISGRQVFAFPGQYAATNLTRSEQLRDYRFRVLVVEQYSDAEGDPPKEWIDARVNFCEQVVFNPLVNPALFLLDSFFPALEEQATVDVLVDSDMLQQNKAFWSLMTFPFQEATTWIGEVT